MPCRWKIPREHGPRHWREPQLAREFVRQYAAARKLAPILLLTGQRDRSLCGVLERFMSAFVRQGNGGARDTVG
jgi:hypothetical protein